MKWIAAALISALAAGAPLTAAGLALGSFQVEEHQWVGTGFEGGFYLVYAHSSDSIFYIEGVGYQLIRPWEVGSIVVATPGNSTYLNAFVQRLTNGIDEEIQIGYFEGTWFGGQRSHGVGSLFESSVFGGSDLAGFSIESIELQLNENASTGSLIRATVTIYGSPIPEPSTGLLLGLGTTGIAVRMRREPAG